MKRITAVCIMILCLAAVLVCTAACAETITAMAVPVNPDRLENTACCVRITDWNGERNALTVEIICPEIFAEEDVLALEAGDAVYTGGEEVPVRTVDRYDEEGYLVVNAGADEYAPGSVRLRRNRLGGYTPERFGRPVYNTLAVLECPVTDSLLFLDWTGADPAGDPDLPVVKAAAELTETVRAAGESGSADGGPAAGPEDGSVIAVFDGGGRLAVVQRFFTPRQ